MIQVWCMIIYEPQYSDCCFISEQKIENILEELDSHLPTADFQKLLSQSLNFQYNKESTLGFYPILKNSNRKTFKRASLRSSTKEKPIPFAPVPVNRLSSSQKQAFQFYQKSLQENQPKNNPTLTVEGTFMIIREMQSPKFLKKEDLLRNLDKIFILLDQREFQTCQVLLNSLIIQAEKETDAQQVSQVVAYLSYLKGLLFDIQGDFTKSLYFHSEALVKLRKYSLCYQIFYRIYDLYY